MAIRDLPDMYALRPRASGTYQANPSWLCYNHYIHLDSFFDTPMHWDRVTVNYTEVYELNMTVLMCDLYLSAFEGNTELYGHNICISVAQHCVNS